MHACSHCGTDIGWAAPSGVCSSRCLHLAQGFPDPYNRKPGDQVRYHSYAWGWRFGTVESVRNGLLPMEPNIQQATVRFCREEAGRPTVCELPSFRLELCS